MDIRIKEGAPVGTDVIRAIMSLGISKPQYFCADQFYKVSPDHIATVRMQTKTGVIQTIRARRMLSEKLPGFAVDFFERRAPHRHARASQDQNFCKGRGVKRWN